MHKKFVVNRDYHNSRFDRWFKQNISNVPQSLIEKIVRKKKIKINKKKIKTSYRVKLNDIVEYYTTEDLRPNNKSKKEKYKPSVKEKGQYEKFIIEDNDNFIVINKPSGIPVQGGTKSFKNITDLLSSTKYFENKKAYIVHRLDKETSGVLIIAKNREYAQLFTSLFRIRKIYKLKGRPKSNPLIAIVPPKYCPPLPAPPEKQEPAPPQEEDDNDGLQLRYLHPERGRLCVERRCCSAAG